ncbi:MAG: MATE family efflux transporter [Tepidisphaeraceae bacterium]|jgi:MATE family multidrug resistance protein
MTATDSPRSPLAELLYLATPTVAQMASYTVMQFIDTWMLSRLGGVPANAAANSGILSFAALSLGMGTVVLVNTLVSQAFGRRDFAHCGRYLWQGIWIGLLFGLALAAFIPFGEQMFRAFGHSPDLVALETIYWRIVLLSASVKLVSMSLGEFLLGINRPLSACVAGFAGVALNAVLAWCVVLGHCGFRSHGVAGAAWSQNAGVTCEMLVLLLLAMRPAIRKTFNTLDFRPRYRDMLDLIRVGIPSGLQWLTDILAWAVFCNGVLAVVSPAAMQANTFMLRYMVVSFMPVVGIGAAVTALVGRYIGQGQPDIAARRAHLGFFISLLYVMICGAVFIIFRHPLMRLFTDDPEVLRIGGIYLILAAIYEIFDAMYIIYISALRGAGDTLVPALMMAIMCWTISVYGGYVVAHWVPQWNPAGPWIMGCDYGAVIGIYMIARFRSGRWRDIRLHPESLSNVVAPPATLEAMP